MSAASRYWTLIGINSAGKRISEEITPAKTFFLESFPEFTAQSEVPDALVQRQLLHWMKEVNQASDSIAHAFPEANSLAKRKSPGDETATPNESSRVLAQICLHCFISSEIERVCRKLEAQFGAEHGFTCSELLRFVLDDGSLRQRRPVTTSVTSSYQSLFDEILDSFDPEQSGLATWTTRRVKHHKELNAFLLEHGVYLVSDWAILNDTNPKQLQRIFAEFHQLTSGEILQAARLLESYHAVYRAQRLKQRQAGIRGHCVAPSLEQLNKIAQHLSSQTAQVYRPETLMKKLQDMASRLRQYRIYVRGGALPTQSLDAATATESNTTTTERISFLDFADNRNTTDEPSEFLDFYRQQFIICLDQAIAKVTNDYASKIERTDPLKAEKFLTALQLFHCQGRSMTEIAPIVNLQAQFHVSRLLKLKSLRGDIQQQLLLQLRDRIFEYAQAYTSPERLQTFHQLIEQALEEQISHFIQEAATEASTATIAKNKIISSLFAQRLCRYLDKRLNL
ncbi:MAG TPA: hypothetical protein V6C85_10160 [Allocoleopsis sp.]